MTSPKHERMQRLVAGCPRLSDIDLRNAGLRSADLGVEAVMAYARQLPGALV